MTSALNTTAVAWALSIPCKPELRGVLVTVAGRSDDDNVLRRDMTTLCYELSSDVSTVRRLFAHLETLGLITRETRRGGPGTQQIIRIHVEKSAVELRPIVAANPNHTHRREPDPRVVARDNPSNVALVEPTETPKPAQQSHALLRGSSETRATIPRDVARVEMETSGASKGTRGRAVSVLVPSTTVLSSPVGFKDEDVPIAEAIGPQDSKNDVPAGRTKTSKPTPSGLVIDAFKAHGLTPIMLSRDHGAIKQTFQSGRPWDGLAAVIVDCYQAVSNGEWGGDFERKNLSIHSVCGWIDAYESWVSHGKPTPITNYSRNGQQPTSTSRHLGDREDLDQFLNGHVKS